MTAFLAESYSFDKNYPSDKARFFDGTNEMDEIIEFMKKRECPLPGFPPPCGVNIFWFFLRRRNNDIRLDMPFYSSSNVARLDRAFPDAKDCVIGCMRLHLQLLAFIENKIVKRIMYLGTALLLSACALQARKVEEAGPRPTATAQVGIVNHTGKYIYSASVDGAGGGNMARWGAGLANICCTSIPRVWYPGMMVLVRWDMPEEHTHIVKEKMVEVEKYDEPGDIYMHFFENGEVRVVVSNAGGRGKTHPILHAGKPASFP